MGRARKEKHLKVGMRRARKNKNETSQAHAKFKTEITTADSENRM